MDVKRAADLYAQGWTLRQIGVELSVHWSTVSQQLQRAGVPVRRGGPPAHPPSTQQILELRDQDLSWTEVAQQVDMTRSGAWSRYRRAQPRKPQRLGRWQQVLADALNQNLAVGVRAAIADHLGRAPNRAELTAARRAAHSLAALGRARVLYVPGADTDDNAGDRTYLVLAKRNVIMNDIQLRGLAVAGSDAAGRKRPPQPRPDGPQPQTLTPDRGRWRPANPSRRVGQHIGHGSRDLACRCPRRASPAEAAPRPKNSTRAETLRRARQLGAGHRSQGISNVTSPRVQPPYSPR